MKKGTKRLFNEKKGLRLYNSAALKMAVAFGFMEMKRVTEMDVVLLRRLLSRHSMMDMEVIAVIKLKSEFLFVRNEIRSLRFYRHESCYPESSLCFGQCR